MPEDTHRPSGPPGRPPDRPERMDDDGFVTPMPHGGGRKRGRPRGSKNKTKDTDLESVTTENSFASLNDDDLGENEIDYSRKRMRKMRQPKPPPLIIPNLNFKDVEKKLSGLEIPREHINRRIVKGTTTKIYVSSCDEHRLLRQHLNRSKTKYMTYTPADERLIRFVMYGLPDDDVGTVKKAIHEKLQIMPTEVKKMKITKKRYPEQANYVIYFSHDSNVTLNDLKSVRGILGYHVFFERYRRDDAPTQCFNCQRYTHASRNCTMDPVCNRCGGPHRSTDCNKVNKETGKVPDEELKCSNCHGNHTASSMNCPERLKLMNERRELAKQRENNARQSRYVNQFNNYNDHFPSHSNKNNTNPSFKKPATDTYTRNLSYAETARMYDRVPDKRSNSNTFSARQLMAIFKEMVRICASCHTREEQLIALTDIVDKYIIDD